jgi:hypothetical protein
MKVPWCFGFLSRELREPAFVDCRSSDSSIDAPRPRRASPSRAERPDHRSPRYRDTPARCRGLYRAVHGNGADRSRKRIITLHRGSTSSTHQKALACKQFRSVYWRSGRISIVRYSFSRSASRLCAWRQDRSQVRGECSERLAWAAVVPATRRWWACGWRPR